MDQRTTNNASLTRTVCAAALSAAFLAVCSLSTTPLLQFSPGQDSAFFRLVGLGMTKGLLPYRDYFDMKGPYLFWLQYLGQSLFPGRLGAFFVQWLCMTVSVLLIAKCLDLAKGRVSIWKLGLLLLPLGYVMSYTMTGGNLTEELSMPFLMPCLYLFLLWLEKAREGGVEDQDHAIWAGFFYGVVFGIMAFIRVTNAALLGAILLTVTVDLIIWKRWKNLFQNAGMFLAGILAGVLPGILWCLSQGILGEMFSQVFFFGFAYSGESGLLDSLLSMGKVRLCLLLVFVPLVMLMVLREKDWRCWLFFAASALTTIVAALMGNGYCHYFVLAVPNLTFAGYLLLRGEPTPKGRFLTLGLTLAILAAQWPLFRPRALEEVRYAMYCAANHLEDRQEYDDIQVLKGLLPQGEPVYVYGFPSCSAVYIQAGWLPPNKYCDWQPHYIQLDSQIGGEIVDFLQSDASQWVVTPNGEPEPATVSEALEENYESVLQVGNFRLWKKE